MLYKYYVDYQNKLIGKYDEQLQGVDVGNCKELEEKRAKRTTLFFIFVLRIFNCNILRLSN